MGRCGHKRRSRESDIWRDQRGRGAAESAGPDQKCLSRAAEFVGSGLPLRSHVGQCGLFFKEAQLGMYSVAVPTVPSIVLDKF